MFLSNVLSRFQKRRIRANKVAFWAMGALFWITSLASAQTTKEGCPGLEAKATAAEQALCWFVRDRSSLKECQFDSEGSSKCVMQSVAWCADAALDTAPVADACFLAFLRLGQLDQAQSVARYLQTPEDQARRCREALETVTARVVTSPAGAIITVDGQRYGRAPVETRLTGNWWTKKIVAIFDSGTSTNSVEVSRDKLIKAFDKRSCIMGDVVIEGPEIPADDEPDLLEDERPRPTPTTATTETEQNSGGFFQGRLWTWVAAGGAVAFGGAALGFGLQNQAQYDDLMKKCTDGCSEKEIDRAIDRSGVKTSALLTNVSLGLSGACLVGAVVLYFLEGSPSNESRDVTLSVGAGGAFLEGRF